jgi:hypothetical protein
LRHPDPGARLHAFATGLTGLDLDARPDAVAFDVYEADVSLRASVRASAATDTKPPSGNLLDTLTFHDWFSDCLLAGFLLRKTTTYPETQIQIESEDGPFLPPRPLKVVLLQLE